MQITRKDLGYTIYSRLEESIRFWLSQNLLKMYGNEWRSQIPDGIWTKIQGKLSIAREDVDGPEIILDETDMPDLMEITCHQKQFNTFVPDSIMTINEFRDKMIKLYDIRCAIAHVKQNFSAMELDLLIEIAYGLLPLVQTTGSDLSDVLKCIKTNPETVVVTMPASYFIDKEKPLFAHITNLPVLSTNRFVRF